MKSVYLINSVKDGGKTYLEYLRPALKALQGTCHCIVLQTDITGMDRYQSEQFLGFPVEEVSFKYIAELKNKTVISNDAFVGAILDESNFSIFISHGNVGMPLKDEYYCASLISYWDAIISPSRSMFELLKAGLQSYRYDRKSLILRRERMAHRSDLRKTSIISTLPVKVSTFLNSPPASSQAPGEYVVGLLPTQVGICPHGASLFQNIETVINSVKSQVPCAKIILRPYMADLDHVFVKDVCAQLSQYPWISIDDAGGSSKEFYERCDTIITDASSGGVSFMLNTGRLPIYYVPASSANHPVVSVWLQKVGRLLPVAKDGDELKDLLQGFELITPEQSYFIYKDFYESQYGGLHHPEEVFHSLVYERHESKFCSFSIDEVGEVSERTIEYA